MNLIALAIGGSLGALSRHFLGSAVLHWTSWPAHGATFIVNVSGCFAMGFLATLMGLKGQWSEGFRLFLFTGFLASYTTFSTFALEGFLLWETKSWFPMLGYLLGSVVLGLLALSLGTWLARWSFGQGVLA